MLKQFKVDNFKSLVNVSFEPAGLNLLVGSNNAGKTNLCHAMWFLSLTSRMPLADAAQRCTAEHWNLHNVYLDKATIDLSARCALASKGKELEFEYELSLNAHKPGASSYARDRLEVRSEVLRVTGANFDNTVLLENHDGKARVFDEAGFLGNKSGANHYSSARVPLAGTMLGRLYDLSEMPSMGLFKRYLGSWQYFSFESAELRGNAAQPFDSSLQPNGENLASVLYALKSSDERRYKRIVEAAALIEPKLDLINFHPPDPDHVYLFFEDTDGHKFGVRNISDGTLRYLALCTVIVMNRRASTEDAPSPLVIVEEPENGVFVGHLKPLFEKLEPSGQDGQFIFASHAPYFIDLFDSCLDGVWVVKNLRTHSSVERPPREKLLSQLGQHSLGEQFFRGLFQ